MNASVALIELYASIQGESTHAGRPCTFVRLAGCPLRCTWCDSAYTFGKGQKHAIADIVQQVLALGVPLVEVTGGEPLAQKMAPLLLKSLCDAGLEVLLETSGAYPFSHLDPRVTVIADLKCPGSGEAARNLWPELLRLRQQDELKIVVANRADFDWALAVRQTQLNDCRAKVLWSAAAGQVPLAELVDWLLAAKAPGRLQLQMHKIIWPNVDKGV